VYLLLWSLHQQRSLRALAPLLVVTGLLALLVVVRHRSNIARLVAGTESKIGQRHGPEGQTEPPRPQDTKKG
jgi:glycerol-3-phosphate acyltransferase PlsY